MNTKDKRHNEKLVSESLRKWIPKLRLTHYDVTFTVSQEPSGMAEGAAAEINIQVPYLSAHITVYPCAFTHTQHIDEVIVHELCHLITEPMYLFGIDGVTNKELPHLESAREQATEHIAKLMLSK